MHLLRPIIRVVAGRTLKLQAMGRLLPRQLPRLAALTRAPTPPAAGTLPLTTASPSPVTASATIGDEVQLRVVKVTSQTTTAQRRSRHSAEARKLHTPRGVVERAGVRVIVRDP